jgi:hypothetical protein
MVWPKFLTSEDARSNRRRVCYWAVCSGVRFFVQEQRFASRGAAVKSFFFGALLGATVALLFVTDSSMAAVDNCSQHTDIAKISLRFRIWHKAQLYHSDCGGDVEVPHYKAW